jgi:hypothetical protein
MQQLHWYCQPANIAEQVDNTIITFTSIFCEMRRHLPGKRCTVDRDIDFNVPDQAQAIKIACSNHRPLSINSAGYCSKCPKRTNDELDMFETPGAIANDTSLLLAERSKKRGWKRQKTQKAFIRIVCATLMSRTGLFDAPANAFLHARLVLSRQ